MDLPVVGRREHGWAEAAGEGLGREMASFHVPTDVAFVLGGVVALAASEAVARDGLDKRGNHI